MGSVKKINFIISLVVYPYDIMVSMGQTDSELKVSLKKANCEWDDLMMLKGNGRFYMNEKEQSLIRLEDYPTTNFELGTLAHEIFHVTTHILDRCGLKLKLGTSDEAYCYMIGFITREIYSKLKIKNR